MSRNATEDKRSEKRVSFAWQGTGRAVVTQEEKGKPQGRKCGQSTLGVSGPAVAKKATTDKPRPPSSLGGPPPRISRRAGRRKGGLTVLAPPSFLRMAFCGCEPPTYMTLTSGSQPHFTLSKFPCLCPMGDSVSSKGPVDKAKKSPHHKICNAHPPSLLFKVRAAGQDMGSSAAISWPPRQCCWAGALFREHWRCVQKVQRQVQKARGASNITTNRHILCAKERYVQNPGQHCSRFAEMETVRR